MSSSLIVVKLDYDPEAEVWFISNSSFPGLAGEAETFESLANRIPNMLADLIEAGSGDRTDLEIPVEIIASLSRLVKIQESA